MLFGRKNPPTGSPKPEGADAAGPALPDAGAAEPSATSPASVSPVPSPSVTPPQPSGLQPAPTPVPAPAAPAPAPAAAPVAATTYRPPLSDKGPEMTSIPPKPPASPSTPGATAYKPGDYPRRVVDSTGGVSRPQGFGTPTAPANPAPAPLASPAPAASRGSDQRRLTVGRDISLSGEIGSCDVLVVEGTVEAKLRDGRTIEITDGGLFKGSVEIDEADIGGRFEGDLSVRGRLTVRSTGKITGSIKYGELTVESGAQLTGDIQMLSKGAPAAAAGNDQVAAAPLGVE